MTVGYLRFQKKLELETQPLPGSCFPRLSSLLLLVYEFEYRFPQTSYGNVLANSRGSNRMVPPSKDEPHLFPVITTQKTQRQDFIWTILGQVPNFVSIL